MKNLMKSILPIAGMFAITGAAIASPIPSPLKIWVLDDHDVQGTEFQANLANYNRDPANTLQKMTLNIGDANARGNGDLSARVEAWGGFEFQPSATYHSFTANVNVSNPHSESVCIAQVFDADNGPLLQVRMEPNGSLTFTDHGAAAYEDLNNPGNLIPANGILATGLENQNFLLKIRTNGWWQEIYINGVKKYAHAPHHYTANPIRDGFRWGLYINEPANGKIVASFWNMVRN